MLPFPLGTWLQCFLVLSYATQLSSNPPADLCLKYNYCQVNHQYSFYVRTRSVHPRLSQLLTATTGIPFQSFRSCVIQHQ